MAIYLLDTMFRKLDEGTELHKGEKHVFLLTPEEFEQQVFGIPHKKAMIGYIQQIAYCKAELYGSCILGTLSIPMKSKKVEKVLKLGFYIQDTKLYLLGDEEQLIHMVGRMRENQFPKDLSVFGFFCFLLNSWIDNDFAFIQSCESRLSELEDRLLKRIPEHFYSELVPCRRDLMALHSYYYQLMNLVATMEANTNHMLSDEDCLLFEHFASRVERLQNHVETLQEYTLQIREMYLTQINLSQSKAMNLLTVISAIFLPLTLLVGWYGMNFAHMPELAWTFGYPGVAVLAILIVVLEIIIFHKKHLL